MTIKRHCRVAITGAAGQIGYALAFRIASGQMFGPHTTVDLHLIELPQAVGALDGVRMELHDCAFPLLGKVLCTDDLNVGFADIDWALLVGAAPRKAGMERADLLGMNGQIFKTQGAALNRVAPDHAQTLVVGNPCNTNAMIAMHHAPRLNRHHFYAMTMLDENRARAQLALRAGCSVQAVSDMIIWGNHSATQFPDFYHATIEDVSVRERLQDDQWLQESFLPTVQKRGAAVIQARGASSAASAANGIVDTVACVDGQTDRPDTAFSMGIYSDGQYDAPEGLIVSYPCLRQTDGSLKILDDWRHDTDFAQEKLKITFDELAQERATVAALGLLD